MSGLLPAAWACLAVGSFGALCFSITTIRRDHAQHVHTLWYVFSLTLCCVSVLFAYIYASATSIQSSLLGGWTGKLAVLFMGASMDVREELYILGTVAALLIAPQVLSYVLSGVFGCGSPPVLVATISRIVTWMLIKFFCILSGILVAQSIVAFYGKPYLSPTWKSGVGDHLASAGSR